MCLVNWLNHTAKEKINELCKSAISQSKSIGCQGAKMRTETIVGASNFMKSKSYNLWLFFCTTPNAHDTVL